MDQDQEDVRLTDLEKEVGTPTKITKPLIIGISSAVVAAVVIVLCVVLIGHHHNNYNPVPKKEDLEFTEEQHHKLTREFATEGMVLAVNNALPLQSTDQVVLFGLGSNDTIYGGLGSGQVYEKGTMHNINPVHIREGIEAKVKEGKILYKENNIGWEIGLEGNLTDNDIKEFAEKIPKAQRSVGIITISRLSSEGFDRPQDSSLFGTLLTENEKETYNSLVKHFDKVVVILNVGSVMELEGIESNEKTSILISFLPGMEAGNAIADVLVGDANPSGHLTDTWAKKIEDYPTTATFLEDDIFVKYKEGLFVGYRYFEDDEEKQKKIVFPFGFGLSYTTFEANCKEKSANDDEITISCFVKNTGNYFGKQVVQIYVEKPQNEKFIKAKRELVGFAKTKKINPGENDTLTIPIKVKDLASYDDTGVTGNLACYVLEKGEYKLYSGFSVADTRNATPIYTYKINSLKVTEKLHTRIPPKDEEVKDANTKPKFEEFMYKNLNTKNNTYKITQLDIENYLHKQEEELKKRYVNDDKEQRQDYSQLPSFSFNKINFKTVLQKKHKFNELVDTMTNEELSFLAHGHNGNIRGGTGSIGGLYNSGILGKYLIPSGDTLDGPAGLRHSDVKLGSTAWPCSTALASSFNIDIMRQVGEATGKEARKIGCSFWLAPGMNIHRNPLCGRNFEYYSEDPFLTGKMAANIAIGLQSKRVSITLKHFAFNNKERNRGGGMIGDQLASDSRVAERVAREIYLKGFEIAVKEGKPWSIMSSYNRVNGQKTAENYDLLTGILRDEWGYDGLVMTDWMSNSKNDREAHAGGDVKMPVGSEFDIYLGLLNGKVTREELKKNTVYIMKTLSKTAAIDTLFKNSNYINIKENEKTKIKVYEAVYNKANGISYDFCYDEDEGYNLYYTSSDTWVTILIDNPIEGNRDVRIRYSSYLEGFGVIFKKYDDTLGEINNLQVTGGYQQWQTSPDFNVFLPKGKYELTIMFSGYDYVQSLLTIYKGNINWIEISEVKK